MLCLLRHARCATLCRAGAAACIGHHVLRRSRASLAPPVLRVSIAHVLQGRGRDRGDGVPRRHRGAHHRPRRRDHPRAAERQPGAPPPPRCLRLGGVCQPWPRHAGSCCSRGGGPAADASALLDLSLPCACPCPVPRRRTSRWTKTSRRARPAASSSRRVQKHGASAAAACVALAASARRPVVPPARPRSCAAPRRSFTRRAGPRRARRRA